MANVPISGFTVPANTVGIGATGYSLTGSANASFVDLAGTWNTSGTPTLIKANVTDTASNAASLLMDLQVGGSSQFRARKDGYFSANLSIGATGLEVFTTGGGALGRSGDRTAILQGLASGGLSLPNSGSVSWASGTSALLAAIGDLILSRKGAGNLRLGAADAAAPVAQTLSVQSVVAGTTNTAGANLTIAGSQGTGTGAGGSIVFQVAPAGSSGTAQNALATALTINSDRSLFFSSSGSATVPTFFWNTNPGVQVNYGIFSPSQNNLGVTISNAERIRFSIEGVQARLQLSIGTTMGSPDVILATEAAGIFAFRGINTSTGAALGLVEMTAPAAPAANGVRIYAVDNGSGKTQLMALFATGAAQQLAIEP